MSDTLAPPIAEPSQPDPLYSIFVDDDGVVMQSLSSNVVPDDYTSVSAEVYNEATTKLGKSKYVDGVLEDITPVVEPGWLLYPLNRMQLPTAFAECEIISWREAEDWATGKDLPDLLACMTPRERMFLLATPAFYRHHEVIEKIQAMLTWDDERFSEMWHYAATL